MSIDHTPNHGAFRIDPDTQRRIEAYARAVPSRPGNSSARRSSSTRRPIIGRDQRAR